MVSVVQLCNICWLCSYLVCACEAIWYQLAVQLYDVGCAAIWGRLVVQLFRGICL